MPSFANPDGSYFNRTLGNPVHVVAPATGATVAMRTAESDMRINNSGTLAALTVLLPPPAYDGHKVDISIRQDITAFTMKDTHGNALAASPTAVTSGNRIIMRWVDGAWVWWA